MKKNLENEKKLESNKNFIIEKNLKIKRKNDEVIKEFLNFLEFEKGDSHSTLIGYKRDLKQFFSYLKKSFDEILEEEIFDFIQYISKKLKESSVLRKVSVIKSFYKFCYLNNFTQNDPTGTIKLLKKEEKFSETFENSNMTTEIYTHIKKSKLKKIYNNIKLGDD
ncbi:tyrosine-type recombinase/integrase [Leptotrichia sp. oral taxon 847]|uniref:tyrosine-type recombinase/integrase n=1 Tax=Leptotrichia sp. oral taxon 847 TaxID=1785996 RepID=UPI00076800D3|nr:site-specific integrase [Leptotrichia sp. oral taxon 847]AMD94493.1 hypothetical protein AXF11_02025 [Leptotrichia sp. oral taxon 847]